MYHLFPAESSRASDISISRSSHSAAPQAATSFTHDTQIEQQHPQQVEATPDEPDQQQPEEVVSPQAASTQEPAGWVSPNQQSQQLLQQPQAQLQRELEDSFQQGNRISYGETAGYQDKWIGTSGKRAGKQLLATKGTRPITINHMSWEVPEGSPTPAEEEAVVQPQPGRGRPRQSKLGTKPTPRSQQRQLSPQTETSPPSLPQPGNALPHPGNALPQPGNALSRSGSVSAQPRSASSQPDGIPPHLPAAASQSPPAASAHSAAALSHASSALQASYSQGNAQQPRHNVQLDSSVNWQRMWTTEAADHSGDVVTTCLHLASMTDLPDNGEHAGVLHLLQTAHERPCLAPYKAVAFCFHHLHPLFASFLAWSFA